MDPSASNISMDLSINSTTSGVHWGVQPGLQLIVCPCVIIMNSTILVLFIIKAHLHQPFNIYLGNLLIANLCFSVFSTPFGILKSVYRSWWLGSIACTAHLYGNFVIASAVVSSHLLITGNRIWAVTFPHSYRHNHTKKLSFVLCAVSWVYINFLCVPGIVLDALYYRLPADAGCYLNVASLAYYHLAVQILLYLLPNFVIIAAYPYLWFACRRRRFRNVVHPWRNDNVELDEIRPSTQRIQATTPSNVLTAQNSGSTGAKRADKDSNHAFTVLTLLTISVTICWTPTNILFTLGSTGLLDISRQSAFYHVSAVLFILQPALDPVLFAAVLPDLRRAVLDLFRRGR